MNSPYSRAPHATSVAGTQPEATNAALLIDFDNVTMGMRSDLSKELNNLLNTDREDYPHSFQIAYRVMPHFIYYLVHKL